MINYCFMKVPKSIVKAEALDLSTSTRYVLGVREKSRCHFFDRFPAGPYEVQLRLDWNDLDLNGDPMLDADVYLPGDTKPVKGSTKFPAHHTPKQNDSATGLYVYQFKFENVDLSLRIQFTHRQNIAGKSKIAPAPKDQPIDPELNEWLSFDKNYAAKKSNKNGVWPAFLLCLSPRSGRSIFSPAWSPDESRAERGDVPMMNSEC